jgi:hypothetical protein
MFFEIVQPDTNLTRNALRVPARHPILLLWRWEEIFAVPNGAAYLSCLPKRCVAAMQARYIGQIAPRRIPLRAEAELREFMAST